MGEFIFIWSDWTEHHIEKHAVAPDEAEFVVVHAAPPFPMSAGADKRVSWGQDSGSPAVRIIHARDLTGPEIRRLRRRKRGAS